MSIRPAATLDLAPWTVFIGILALFQSVPALVCAEPLEVESAYTVIGQTSDDDALDRSTTGSLDLYFTRIRGAGRLEVYVEGNTSLKEDEVATRLPECNADAGTALDTDRSGRMQVSELKYSYSWSERQTITVGLLDPSAYLDATRINNDENLQFLGSSFVNNPTIEFPDYTLGFAGRSPFADGRGRWNMVLASSHGIADNPNLSYSHVLNLTEDDKGAFAGAEAAWPSERFLVRMGAWVNTAEHETLDSEDAEAANHGAYSAVGASWGAVAANLRLGVADPDVSLAARFASISFQWNRGPRVLGLAAAHTWISSRAGSENADHGMHFEGYLRYELTKGLYLTPSIQYLANSGLVSSGTADDDAVVFSLRLHHLFFRRDHPPDR